MRVLAVDTSSRCGAVGISEDGLPIAEISLKSEENHSSRLLPSIEWALSTCRLTLKDIDGFGVVTGPGSFTGLRVGLATIKGLAWAEKKPVAALHSLEVLARNLYRDPRIIIPMLDARKGRVYAAAYKWEGNHLITLSPPADVEVSALLSQTSDPCVVLGEGARRYESVITEFDDPHFEFAPVHLDFPRGAIVANMALEAVKKGDIVDVAAIEPVYLRLSETESKERQSST